MCVPSLPNTGYDANGRPVPTQDLITELFFAEPATDRPLSTQWQHPLWRHLQRWVTQQRARHPELPMEWGQPFTRFIAHSQSEERTLRDCVVRTGRTGVVLSLRPASDGRVSVRLALIVPLPIRARGHWTCYTLRSPRLMVTDDRSTGGARVGMTIHRAATTLQRQLHQLSQETLVREYFHAGA